MNIFITGATGFIGAKITADLIAAGHHVTCAVRHVDYAKRIFPSATVIACNFLTDVNESDWLNRLKNMDVLINCVGIMHHPNKAMIDRVHTHTVTALFQAAVKQNIQHIIQLSALGIENSTTDYATSKKAGDEQLLSLPIRSTIIRPSLVYAQGSYGGTSLFRGLAGLPGCMPVPGKGDMQFQPIHLTDLARAVIALIDNPPSENQILHAVGSERLNLIQLLTKLRAWLGFKPATILKIPTAVIKLAVCLGNMIPYSTLNRNSYQMLLQHNISSVEKTAKFNQHIGFTPVGISEGLQRHPSTVQDRWHARLFMLKPALRVSLAFIWLFTALTSLFWFPVKDSFALLAAAGVPSSLHAMTLYAASLLDGVIGLALLFNYKVKRFCQLQLGLITVYTVIISWQLPAYWLHPFGPISKNIVMLVAILIYLAMETDR